MGADPNVPATAQLVTPLEQVIQLIEFEEERDDRLNDFDQVNRLDDTALAYRPNLKPYKEVKKILLLLRLHLGPLWPLRIRMPSGTMQGCRRCLRQCLRARAHHQARRLGQGRRQVRSSQLRL